MEQALKEYEEGIKPALYIAEKYGINVTVLHSEYAKRVAIKRSLSDLE